MNQPIIAMAPMRVSFSGGGTDLPEYYELYGGEVISSTINRYAISSIYPRNDKKIGVFSSDLGAEFIFDDIGSLKRESGKVEALLCGCISRLHSAKMNGFNIYVRSDARPGSGLGGSAAVCVSVLAAVARFNHLTLQVREFCELAFAVEREDLGMACGKQDQWASGFGGFNNLKFSREKVSVKRLDVSYATKLALRAHILFFNTKITRVDLGIVSAQINSVEACDQDTLGYLNQMKDLCRHLRDALLANDMRVFGRILYEGFLMKIGLNPSVDSGVGASDFINECVDIGAYGGKLLGAGGGGYVLLIAPPECHTACLALAKQFDFDYERFEFDDSGVVCAP